jgi:hypothetical protein
MSAILNCFYDFTVCPAYYDFLTFLQSSELHRIRHGFNGLRIIFVKGPNNGFRQDNLRTPASNQLMFRNVLLPSCHLLESVVETMWVSKRTDCTHLLHDADAIFPRGYSLERPVSDYFEGSIQCAFLRGESISHFRAPADKTAAARTFLDSVSRGRKVITLTLREAEHDATDRRRLDEREWTLFFNSEVGSQYQPVIVRDTAKLFSVDNVFPMFPQAPLASSDVLFRTALYENAYLNIFPNNGPYTCALYSNSNSLLFKPHDNRVISTSEKWLQDVLGLAFGDQRPISEKRTVMIWEDDCVSEIEKAVTQMDERITEKASLSDKHGLTSRAQAIRTVNVALKDTFTKLTTPPNVEDLFVLTQIQKLSDIFEILFGSNQSLCDFLLSSEGKFFRPGTIRSLRELENRVMSGFRI